MNLQTILFGDFVPPPVVSTRVISISGFGDCKRYKPPKGSDKVKPAKPAYAAVHKALSKKPRATTAELAKMIRKSDSYTHRILGELKDMGKVGSVLGPKTKGGGNTCVLYFNI